MSEIKTYYHINEEDHNLSFRINRMEEVYDERNGAIDEPHRHNYFTVLAIEKARGEHLIDFNSYALGQYQIFFVNPSQVHQVVWEERPKGFALLFSEQFLIYNHIPNEFIDNLNLFNSFDQWPPLEMSKRQFSEISDYASKIIATEKSNESFQYDSIGALLKLILIKCNNVCQLHPTEIESIDSGNTLLKKYKKLIDKNYKLWHGVSEYANELNVSADHLNRVVKSSTGKTAKEHIQTRLTVAAKRLIYFSDLSTKELAYEIGFSEPANFSSFFKKQTGMTSTEFKQLSSVK